MPSGYFLTEDLLRLTAGSYEALLEEVEALVDQNLDRLFGRGVPARILATFPSHALVLSEEGKCLRLKYRRQGESLVFLGSESVSVPVYQDEDVERAQLAEAGSVVDKFLSGRLTEARAEVSQLARSLTESVD